MKGESKGFLDQFGKPRRLNFSQLLSPTAQNWLMVSSFCNHQDYLLFSSMAAMVFLPIIFVKHEACTSIAQQHRAVMETGTWEP